MPRLPRVNVEGALYYITCRGIDNNSIFLADEDYRTYLKLLWKYKQEYGFKLFSFVLLANHLHLLLELRSGLTISEIMHRVNSLYTKYFNAKYSRTGHLLQERYKSVIIEKEPYLAAVATYIHREPLRKNIARDLSSYPYSSYPLYSGAIKSEMDLSFEIREVSALLGPDARYTAFAEAFTIEQRQALEAELRNKKFIGSEEFISAIHERIENSKTQKTALTSTTTKTLPPAESLMHIEGPTPGVSRGLFSKGNPRFQASGVAIIAILSIIALYQYQCNLKMAHKFNRAMYQQQAEFAHTLHDEKEQVKKDLEEKYQADIVSYQAMARRLQEKKSLGVSSGKRGEI